MLNKSKQTGVKNRTLWGGENATGNSRGPKGAILPTRARASKAVMYPRNVTSGIKVKDCHY